LKEISALINLLGDDDFAAREDAFKSLVAMGTTKEHGGSNQGREATRRWKSRSAWPT